MARSVLSTRQEERFSGVKALLGPQSTVHLAHSFPCHHGDHRSRHNYVSQNCVEVESLLKVRGVRNLVAKLDYSWEFRRL